MADQLTMELDDLSVEEVCSLLQSKGFEPDVIGVLRRQKVAGCILLDMDDEEMAEIGIEAWGDRRRLRKLISSSASLPPQKTRLTPARDAGNQSVNTSTRIELVSFTLV